MNCQQEPAYPGAETVVFSIRDPDLTYHRPSPLCAINEPHRIGECGEFVGTAETPEAMRREIDREPRLRRRPLPPGGRIANVEQRAFDVVSLRYDGLTYAQIGRRVGVSGQRAKELCCWGTSCRCEFCTEWEKRRAS